MLLMNGIPPQLYSFVHEMGHFAAYVLQRFPIQLARVISKNVQIKPVKT